MYQGSAKNVIGRPGDKEIQFEFSDHYSVFDWGRMPNVIPGKGAANKFFTTLFFTMFENKKSWRGFSVPNGVLSSESGAHLERLKKDGLKTHLVSSKDGDTDNRIVVKAVDVIHPKFTEGKNQRWDYYQYKKRVVDALVPLEIIFRFEIVAGSSILERATDVDYLKDLDVSKIPVVGDRFARPIIEFSTKLEEKDRVVGYAEARDIAGMSVEEFEKLYYNAFWASLLLKSSFQEIGINLIDGKFEFAFVESGKCDREFMLVDSIGPDELRLEANDYLLSKEFLRHHYRSTSWYQAVIESKKIAKERSSVHWKEICKNELGEEPTPLPQSLITECSNIYCWPKLKLEERFLPNLRVVVLGQGGREHAVSKKLLESTMVSEVIVIPGNDGMLRTKGITTRTGVKLNDIDAIISEIKEIAPSFVFVGPESLLAQGIVDRLQILGVKCIGPDANTARLESSKIFAKNLMRKYGIPTADFVIARGYDDAIEKLKLFYKKGGVVIKCDELASGKGVVVADSLEEATNAIYDFAVNSSCSVKSNNFVIEEKLDGKELSFFVFCDGKNYVRIGAAHDYKRAIEGGQGPNTGGMGGFSAKVDGQEKLYRLVETDVVEPLLEGMAKDQMPFKGVLFVGLMVNAGRVDVLEFNVRLGDPETQVILPLVESDFAKICLDTINGSLQDKKVVTSLKRAVHVVLASKGYPDISGKGMLLEQAINIENENLNNQTEIYFAGVKASGDGLISSGGRVLGVTSISDDLAKAKSYVYEAMEMVSMEGGYYRRDIAAGELL